MDCQDFLARYSEYCDEFMERGDAERMRRHLEACARCERYDRVMRRGLDLARAMPPIRPSSDFQVRLEHRLLHVRDEVGADGRAPSGGAAVSLALAGLLALAAWGPLLNAGRDGARAVVAEAAEYANDASMPAGGATADDWWAAATQSITPAFMPLTSSLGASFPGPHSPLVVMPPPVYYGGNVGRAQLMSYPTID